MRRVQKLLRHVVVASFSLIDLRRKRQSSCRISALHVIDRATIIDFNSCRTRSGAIWGHYIIYQ